MMKKYALLVMALCALSLNAKANDIAGLNAQIDDLEVEQEMEELEDFGESAAIETAKSENAKVAAETKQLEKEIKQMEKRNARNKEKVTKLTKTYQEKASLAAKSESKHRKASKELNASQARVDRLKAKVDASEARVISAVHARKAIERNIVRLENEKRNLEQRLKVAQRAQAKQKTLGRAAMKREKQLLSKTGQLRKSLARH